MGAADPRSRAKTAVCGVAFFGTHTHGKIFDFLDRGDTAFFGTPKVSYRPGVTERGRPVPRAAPRDARRAPAPSLPRGPRHRFRGRVVDRQMNAAVVARTPQLIFRCPLRLMRIFSCIIRIKRSEVASNGSLAPSASGSAFCFWVCILFGCVDVFRSFSCPVP